MRKRNIRKQYWINETEEKILREKAKQSGLSQGELIRSMIKGYRIKAQPTDEIKQFQSELHGIANNINQMARISNAKGYVEDEDIDELLETLSNFILRFEKLIYSRQR